MLVLRRIVLKIELERNFNLSQCRIKRKIPVRVKFLLQLTSSLLYNHPEYLPILIVVLQKFVII
jgi:hypothetical protein